MIQFRLSQRFIVPLRVIILIILHVLPSPHSASAQIDSSRKFTRGDTLRGMLTPLRSCYDVQYYDLQLDIDIRKRSLRGSNTISFNVVSDFDSMQVDLFGRMKIDKIVLDNEELKFRREFDAVFVRFPVTQIHGSYQSIKVFYSGVPLTAKAPPWDGGFVWKKDAEGKDWVGVACQGTGASLWWPCKDHLSDEPDSMRMRFTVPTGLMCISNGTLIDTANNGNGTTTWNWKVHYPINNYNITLNLADYRHLSDYYVSGNNRLDIDYYILKNNAAKAQEHFQQVKTMLACFEKYFGPYPFSKDGYALVETNYWGMEHQGAIAYGNNYENEQYGFDYIIVHESAHEWWGNNVSCRDQADLWIHESFATYAEALYVEYTSGSEMSVKYLVDQRWKIADKRPIIGPYDVNYSGSDYDTDMYYKGSWMLHTFRNVLQNDSLFFSILKNIQQHFALQTINSDQLISYINQLSGQDYTPFFRQYLYYPDPPILQYKIKRKGNDTKLQYRWKTTVKNFSMPLEVTSLYEYNFGKITRSFVPISPTEEWQTTILTGLEPKHFDVNTEKFYVKKEKVN